ncbi:MAG: pseudouridine synthase [Hespellia sp.]|nr:pseudouridine synthase [Hespellia sp.]
MSNRIRQEFEQKKEAVRLNKYLSESGVCSRREADRLIESGRVTVDGMRAEMGMRVVPGKQEIRLGRKIVSRKDEMVVLAVNKPAGIVCTEERRERNSIIRFLDYPIRITYAGRLDKESTGLLLMTNNGDLINQMMRARNHHEKEYKVTVNQEITEEFLKKMAAGVPILDTITRPCEVYSIGKYTFGIVLTQGLNRQIRRMCEALGYQVTRLKRIRIMNIQLGSLGEGEYRVLTDEELDELYDMLQRS